MPDAGMKWNVDRIADYIVQLENRIEELTRLNNTPVMLKLTNAQDHSPVLVSIQEIKFVKRCGEDNDERTCVVTPYAGVNVVETVERISEVIEGIIGKVVSV